MTIATESVLAVPRRALFRGDWPHGFSRLSGDRAAQVLRRLADLGRFVPRSTAEHDPDLKQPIPYCVVASDARWFCVERLSAQGETRLHGRLSIGIGGHVGPADGHPSGGPALFEAALLRELREELPLPEALPRPVFLGLVNDESDAVGRVHVGLVYALRLPPGAAVEVREIRKHRGGFRHLVGPLGLWQDFTRLESWSALLLSDLRGTTAVEQAGREGSTDTYVREETDDGRAQDPQAVP